MIESTLPRWTVRLDASAPQGFGSLLPIIASHFRVHEDIEKFLGPYNARQRASSFPYRAPDLETLRQLVKPGRMNDASYRAYLGSIVRFCETTKGQRGLPTPHPSSIHSIQLPEPAFSLKSLPNGDTMISIVGCDDALTVKGLNQPRDMKFIVVRPKLSQLGTASATKFEVLFFKQALGYIPEWVDSQLNPRWSGKW